MLHSETLHTINRVEAAVAMGFGLSIVFVYLRWADMRTWSYTLVVLMASTGVVANLGDLVLAGVTMESSPAGCYTHAVVTQFFDMATSLWAVVIAYNLFAVIVKERTIDFAFKLRCHAFVWSVSTLLTLLPLTTSSYGNAGPWCWIKSEGEAADDTQPFNMDTGVWWRFACCYLPVWISFGFIVYYYYHVIDTIGRYVQMSEQLARAESEAGRGEAGMGIMSMRRLAASLYLFPLVFLVSWLVATMARGLHWTFPNAAQDASGPYAQDTASLALRTFGNVSVTQAIGNGVAYNCTKAVRSKWRRFCRCHDPNPEKLLDFEGAYHDLGNDVGDVGGSGCGSGCGDGGGVGGGECGDGNDDDDGSSPGHNRAVMKTSTPITKAGAGRLTEEEGGGGGGGLNSPLLMTQEV